MRRVGALDEAVPNLARFTFQFTTRWWSHDVTSKRRGTKVLIHPQAGSLQIDYEVLTLADDSDQRMITWLPADDATQSAFEQLCTPDLGRHSQTTTPPNLRVVG